MSTQTSSPVSPRRQESEPDTPLEGDPLDEQIVELLARGLTHKEAAAQLGISTKSIQRRVADPTLRRALTSRRRVVLAETTSQLVAVTPDAVGTLAALLGSDNPTVQLRAAQLALTLGVRFHSQDQLESEFAERIERLEAVIGQLSEETQ